MSTLHRRLKLSINAFLIDKNEGGDALLRPLVSTLAPWEYRTMSTADT
jgi:hypothetical protein